MLGGDRSARLGEPRGSAVVAEVLDPDVGVAVAVEAADVESDAEVAEAPAEDVVPVARRVHPGVEDGAHGAVPAAAPGDVLPGPPTARAEIADVLHPVGE